MWPAPTKAVAGVTPASRVGAPTRIRPLSLPSMQSPFAKAPSHTRRKGLHSFRLLIINLQRPVGGSILPRVNPAQGDCKIRPDRHAAQGWPLETAGSTVRRGIVLDAPVSAALGALWQRPGAEAGWGRTLLCMTMTSMRRGSFGRQCCTEENASLSYHGLQPWTLRCKPVCCARQLATRGSQEQRDLGAPHSEQMRDFIGGWY